MEQAAQPARGFRHVFARLDHGRDSLFQFVGRKHGDADADRFQRRPEKLVRRAVGQPIEKLTMIGGAGLHAALLRDVQNSVALGVADVAVGPGDLDQRRQDERGACVERYAELLDALEKRRFVCLKLLCQRVRNLVELGLLAQLLDQPGVLLAEIGFLFATLTVAEYVLLHTTSNRGRSGRHPITSSRLTFHRFPPECLLWSKSLSGAELSVTACR